GGPLPAPAGHCPFRPDHASRGDGRPRYRPAAPAPRRIGGPVIRARRPRAGRSPAPVPGGGVRGGLAEPQRLPARVRLLSGALAASTDGLVLAHDTPGVEAEGVAALTAAALGVSIRMTDATGRGGFRELLVRGGDGYIATYAAGSSAVLTLLAEDRINV